MRIAGALRLGVPAVLLVAVTACASGESPAPAPGAAAAVPSYEAPAGAPDFCSRLASVAELDRLPVSIGTLAAGEDVEARAQVSGVVRELRGVLADVSAEGGHGGLVTALGGLVHALGEVGDGPLPEPVRGAVAAGLEQVDVQTQPTCRFPA
ncbi:MAG: hypothetical protein JHC71_12840 [Blastococcus sp.]|nr:hypothetical protein [Blastococcus sp.]